jgi:hypothetical protein
MMTPTIKNEDRQNDENDARTITIAAMLTGEVRKNDLVPTVMQSRAWNNARIRALDRGWIVKDPHGPLRRGARYIALQPNDDLLEDADLCEQMQMDTIEYAEDWHYEVCRQMLVKNPGESLNAWDFRRDRNGPCTDSSWPAVKRMLDSDDDVERVGIKRGRTYAYIPFEWRLIDLVIHLEEVLPGVSKFVAQILGTPCLIEEVNA